MKMYIFENVRKVSDRYHEDGGLVIIANNRTHAKQLIKNKEDVRVTREEWREVHEYELKRAYEPTIFVFPDAGCC